VTCIPVSLTVLGLAQTPEDTIQDLNQSAAKVELHDNSRITQHINDDGMYLVEGTQNNCFSDGVSKWNFKSELGSPMHNAQPWRHVVGVVDEFFYHLDNGDKQLFRYPISILVEKEGQEPHNNHNYFIRILKIFDIKPKLQYEWDKRKVHSKQLQLDVRCFLCEER